MTNNLKLMFVLAHPDDESLGFGCTIAKYADSGVETHLVTATRGERGWAGDPQDYPGPEALGKIREAELLAAARVLGLRSVEFLDYVDGDLDVADHDEAVAKIAAHVRRVRPHVVVTFDPEGSYGHPDHIAICQFTTAAVVAAADPGYNTPPAGEWPPHTASKLYYYVLTKELLAHYQPVFGELVMNIDGMERRGVGWEDWAITTFIHAEDYTQKVWQAVSCHKSQLPAYNKLVNLSPEEHVKLWGVREYYRVYSLVNGGRKIEYDLFEGLR